MCKTSMVCIHIIGVAALTAAACYIYLNETNQLNRVKRTCFKKVNEVKHHKIYYCKKCGKEQ